mmetsp:Transcript_24288/g.71327  ORF Transcript_24288/g.71327 Transcript_24288/m.71327 type:complete len:229 (-) Transcript_24288:134-820(-)
MEEHAIGRRELLTLVGDDAFCRALGRRILHKVVPKPVQVASDLVPHQDLDRWTGLAIPPEVVQSHDGSGRRGSTIGRSSTSRGGRRRWRWWWRRRRGRRRKALQRAGWRKCQLVTAILVPRHQVLSWHHQSSPPAHRPSDTEPSLRLLAPGLWCIPAPRRTRLPRHSALQRGLLNEALGLVDGCTPVAHFTGELELLLPEPHCLSPALQHTHCFSSVHGHQHVTPRAG